MNEDTATTSNRVVNKFVGAIKVASQIGRFVVVDWDALVREKTWKIIGNISRRVQYVRNT